MTRIWHPILLLCAAVAAFPAAAEYLSGATGHTVLNCPGSLKKCGVIHFAVLDRNAGRYGDSWATGYANFDFGFERGTDLGHRPSPRLDYRAPFLYLYQVTNDLQELPIASGSVPFHIAADRLVTSWGYFQGLGFADDKTGKALTPVSATNPFGITEMVKPGEMSLKVLNPAVVSISGGNDAGQDPYEVVLGRRDLRASWLGGKEIAPGGRGTLFGFTSNHPPGFLKGNVVLKCGHAGEPPCPRQ
jgi:hypothetical protein